MNEDEARLQATLDQISSENAALRQSHGRVNARIHSLQRLLSEISTDLAGQSEQLAALARQSAAASGNALSAARESGDVACVREAESADRVAKETLAAALDMMAYLMYIKLAKFTRTQGHD